MREAVMTDLGYLDTPWKEEDGRPLHYYADFARTSNVRLKQHPVTVTDARDRPGLTLDRNGFTLTRWPTEVRDFIDTPAISDQYVAECEALIRHLTCCEATCQAGPIHCRFDGVIDPSARYDGKPAHYVHSDYSPTSVEMAKAALPDDLSRYGRCAIYNIWRVITPPPQSRPLAVCDVATLRPGDEREAKVIMAYPGGEDVEFFTQLYHPDPRHLWYYFSDMTPAEVLVFKSFDSDPDLASYVPHCAFRDPGQPGAMRVSIEARIAAAFRA